MAEGTLPAATADPEAREFVRDNGGRVYVYCSKAGLEHTSLEKPDGVQFAQVQCNGFILFQDVTIDGPDEGWYLQLRHFPHRHVFAVYPHLMGGPLGSGPPP